MKARRQHFAGYDESDPRHAARDFRYVESIRRLKPEISRLREIAFRITI